MSVLAEENGPQDVRVAASSAGQGSGRSWLYSEPAVIVIGVCLGLILSWTKLAAVWQSGRFFDTDDAMRMVQVRDWLAGQGWFDLTAYRLDPPLGTTMHWTRIVDLPLAFLIRSFSLLATQETAERLTRIVYPVMLQVALYAGLISIVRKLVGDRGFAVAIILAASSISALTQFGPGRVDHQNVQIVLLVFMLSATIDIFDPRRALSGALAGVLAGVSFAVSIEDLPFIAMMIAVFGVTWIVRGQRAAKALAWLGGSLGAAAIMAFVATVPPSSYGKTVCDAFSGVHLVAACLGGISFLILAAATPRLPNWKGRALACALLGGGVLAFVTLKFSDCLGDPFSAVDPLVREVWLANVSQTQPLAKLLWLHTVSTLPIAMPIFTGLGLACFAAWRETGDVRARWFAVIGFTAVGVLGSFWEVRVAAYVACIAVLGAAWLFDRLLRWPNGLARRLIIAPALLVAMVPAAWALALHDFAQPLPRPYGDPDACFASSAFKALDALPPSTVFAPIDAGPYILALTHHSVIDGPYHRDNHGNRLAIEAFLGNEATAHNRILASGSRYLALCPAASELSIYAKLSPKGFAASLRDGRAPSWLHKIDLKGTPYSVYEVK